MSKFKKHKITKADYGTMLMLYILQKKENEKPPLRLKNTDRSPKVNNLRGGA